VDAVQAAIIQDLFHAYADGGVTLYRLAVQLAERGIASPTGGAHWTASTLRLILSNPCYTGTAYSNRMRTRPATRRKSSLQPVGPGESWCFTPPDEWVGIPVPALVSQDVFDRVQARLATNQQLAQRSTLHEYLLRTLVSCGHCRLQCQGRFRAPGYLYYLCNGRQSPVSSSHDVRCHARYIPAEQLDALVWTDLCTVVHHPELITQTLERAHSGAWLPDELHQRHATIQTALQP